MFGRIVLLAVLALPLVEIALFIVIGQAIGVLPTLGLGGLLLLLPGYFTDLVGLLLLLPFTRELIYRLLARNLRVVDVTTSYRRADQPGLIDLDRSDWRDDGPSL